MSALHIKITLDNSAFKPYPEVEVGRILTVLARRLDVMGLEDLQTVSSLMDINGNKVGCAKVTGA